MTKLLLLLIIAPGLFGQGLAPSADLPPRDSPIVEKTLAQLPATPMSAVAAQALEIEPAKWKHAETPNFLLHYRRLTEAQKVAREVEYDLWFTARTLGAGPERYRRKSHVFVFEDEGEWAQFLADAKMPDWTGSFARGDELFLNVRRTTGTSRFASDVLAHEATHAVVARLYPAARWPLWLSEGFAEYMGGASVAARKGQTLKRFQNDLTLAGMSLDQLFALERYPADERQVAQLYQTSEKLVRFLMTELPRDRFTRFVAAILEGATFERALLAVYGDKIPDDAAFEKAFAKFTK